MLPRMIRLLIREIPTTSGAAAARRLIARANAARDARQFGVAAALYLEALRFNPDNARIRIQCGHMLKDSGDLVGAEEQYGLAAKALPDDADLALQLGHFYKIAGRPELAEEHYRRALTLMPGWIEAERELVSVGGAVDDAERGDLPDWIVPELLPRPAGAPAAADRNILRLFRLGGRRARSRWGDLKVLRGVEAIRGYRLAPAGLTEIRLLIDGELARTEALQAYPQDGDTGQFKYVFNLWHDFSPVAPGRHRIELDFIDTADRRYRRHRETLLVVAPTDAGIFPDSDAQVAIPPDAPSIEAAVNAQPSMVRTTERRLLPEPIATILVQRVDQMGDLVCSVPAIRRLRALYPQAKLVGLVSTANAALAGNLGLFDTIEVIAFEESLTERRRVLAIEDQDDLRRRLAAYRFDLAVDFGEGDESRAVLLLSGARFLYGFKDRNSPWLDAGLDFNAHDPVNGIEVIPPSRKFLLLVEGLALLARGGAAPIANPDRTGLAALGIDEGDRYAVLHAGARLVYSRWPHFDALARMILERTGLKVVFLSDDAATAVVAAEEAGQSGRLIVVKGQIDFEVFDALLSHCSLFVGNDSGPKHLAALRGAPVVSLHMARLNWSEWGQEMTGRIISRRVPCAGCGIGLDGEDCGKQFACLRHIKAEEVFAAAESLL